MSRSVTLQHRQASMKLQLTTLVLLASAASAAPVSAQWLDLATPGIPRTADGKPNLSAPLPRAADGHPELTGLWRGRGTTGDLRDLSKVKEWARTAMEEHERNYYPRRRIRRTRTTCTDGASLR